jgi:dephospho-CoA kinase
MKIIGITGGIGNGKGSVSNILAQLGAKVIDADVISKDIIYKYSPAFVEIIEYFGNDILDEKGEVNRKKLGEVVFGNFEKLEELTKITHKYIIKDIVKRIELEKSCLSSQLIVLEASIPVEHGFKDLVDEVWVVVSNLEVRIKRVMHRNGYTRNQVLERINSQMSDDEYSAIADKLIKNSGTIMDLKNEINKLI